jgi:hypothetical protein
MSQKAYNQPANPINMNLHRIKRWQLITLWVLGLIIFFLLFYAAGIDDSPGGQALSLIIPGGLFYHTLGWRKYRKQNYQKIKTEKK